MGFWIKNTDGKPDAILTLSIVGFVTILVKLLFSGLTLTFKGKEVGIGNIDGSSIAAILTPTLGAYVARRYTDKKLASGGNNGGQQPNVSTES